VKRPADQRRKLPPELEAFARGDDEKLRIRRPRVDRGLIHDPREGYTIAGVANRDSRAVYDVRSTAMRDLWDDGAADEEALETLGQLFHDALRLELWHARRLTSFAAFAEEVVGVPVDRAEALAEAAAERTGQPVTPLTEVAIALWLRTEAGLYEGSEAARCRIRSGTHGWELMLTVGLDDASTALAGVGARHLPLARALPQPRHEERSRDGERPRTERPRDERPRDDRAARETRDERGRDTSFQARSGRTERALPEPTEPDLDLLEGDFEGSGYGGSREHARAGRGTEALAADANAEDAGDLARDEDGEINHPDRDDERAGSDVEGDDADVERDDVDGELDEAHGDDADGERDDADAERDDADGERDDADGERDDADGDDADVEADESAANGAGDDADVERDEAELEDDDLDVESDALHAASERAGAHPAELESDDAGEQGQDDEPSERAVRDGQDDGAELDGQGEHVRAPVAGKGPTEGARLLTRKPQTPREDTTRADDSSEHWGRRERPGSGREPASPARHDAPHNASERPRFGGERPREQTGGAERPRFGGGGERARTDRGGAPGGQRAGGDDRTRFGGGDRPRADRGGAGGDRPRFGAGAAGGDRQGSAGGADRPRFGGGGTGGDRPRAGGGGDRPRFAAGGGGDRPRFGGGSGDERPRFGGGGGGDRPRFGGGGGGDRPRFGGGGGGGGDRPRFGAGSGDRPAAERPKFGAGGDRPRFAGGGADRAAGDRPRFGGGGGDRPRFGGGAGGDRAGAGRSDRPRFGGGDRDGGDRGRGGFTKPNAGGFGKPGGFDKSAGGGSFGKQAGGFTSGKPAAGAKFGAGAGKLGAKGDAAHGDKAKGFGARQAFADKAPSREVPVKPSRRDDLDDE
jgi:hypothetical protein